MILQRAVIAVSRTDRPSSGQAPTLTAVIPCLNAAPHIRRCLDSILACDYPRDRLEVLVVDGGSTDGTRAIIGAYAGRYAHIRLLANPRRTIPAAMNLGIGAATGELIARIDAHASVDATYFTACVRALGELGADYVSAVRVIRPGRDTLVARTIALALAEPFGTGGAFYRTSAPDAAPRRDDPASMLSCCPRRLLVDAGGYREDIARSEDIELTGRILRGGGRTVIVPSIRSYYYARTDLALFAMHTLSNGHWVTYPLRFARIPTTWRHYLPLLSVLGLIGGVLAMPWTTFPIMAVALAVAVHLAAGLTTAVRVAGRERSAVYALTLPPTFAALHVLYGTGSLLGALHIVMDGMRAVFQRWPGRETKVVAASRADRRRADGTSAE